MFGTLEWAKKTADEVDKILSTDSYKIIRDKLRRFVMIDSQEKMDEFEKLLPSITPAILIADVLSYQHPFLHELSHQSFFWTNDILKKPENERWRNMGKFGLQVCDRFKDWMVAPFYLDKYGCVPLKRMSHISYDNNVHYEDFEDYPHYDWVVKNFELPLKLKLSDLPKGKSYQKDKLIEALTVYSDDQIQPNLKKQDLHMIII